MVQSQEIRAQLRKICPGIQIEIEPIQTLGDTFDQLPFRELGDKGVFTKELDDSLLRGETDFATHSMKDLPSELASGLTIAAVTPAVDGRDVVVSRGGKKLRDLSPEARIGTSSVRRKALLRLNYPRLKLEELRGNIDTRLKKLKAGKYDAIVIAAAGLKRLGLGHEISEYLDPTEFLPAVGQGFLAVVCRESDSETLRVLRPLNDPGAFEFSAAAREFLKRMQGGCQVPLGCHLRREEGQLVMAGFLSRIDGSQMIHVCRQGPSEAGITLGREVAEEILSRGGREILAELKKDSLPGQPGVSPLRGRRVVITRAKAQSSSLVRMLTNLRATPLVLPMIRTIAPSSWTKVDHCVERLDRYDLLVFTSQNAVRFFQKRYQGSHPFPVPVACVGKKTAKVLRELGTSPAYLPERPHAAEELVELLKTSMRLRGKHILYPKGAEGRDHFRRSMEGEGATVDEAIVYRTVFEERSRSQLMGVPTGERPDWIIFASPSAVRAFFSQGEVDPEQEIMKEWIRREEVKIASIGRVTGQSLREIGIPTTVQPPEPSVEALIELMSAHEARLNSKKGERENRS